MKRIISIVVCVISLVIVTGCTSKRPPNFSTDNSLSYPPKEISISYDGAWPDNEFTFNLPVPDGQINWTMIDSNKESCCVQISEVSEDIFSEFYEKLTDTGFSEITNCDDGKDGEGYISIGTVLSNGDISIAMAYADQTLMIVLLKQSAENDDLHFWEQSNLTNVYAHTYATYDQEGVQVIAELYVPGTEKTMPEFTLMNGIVAITLNGEISYHYFGAVEEYSETIAAVTTTGKMAESGSEGSITVSGVAYSENAVAGGGAFTQTFDITIP